MKKDSQITRDVVYRVCISNLTHVASSLSVCLRVSKMCGLFRGVAFRQNFIARLMTGLRFGALWELGRLTVLVAHPTWCVSKVSFRQSSAHPVTQIIVCLSPQAHTTTPFSPNNQTTKKDFHNETHTFTNYCVPGTEKGQSSLCSLTKQMDVQHYNIAPQPSISQGFPTTSLFAHERKVGSLVSF